MSGGHRIILVIAQDMSLCVSDGQTAMVVTYLYTIYTVTDRFLMRIKTLDREGLETKIHIYLYIQL